MQFKNVRVFATQSQREKKLLAKARKRKDIIYGGQSIKAQIGIFARPTSDFDIFTKQPKKAAMNTEKDFDRIVGFDYFYTKPAKHPGTWKVKGRGVDLRKGTRDDEETVDYSKYPRPKPKVIMINGVQYRKLSQEKKAKYKAIRDPKYKFRKAKDTEDVNRINLSKSMLPNIQIGIKRLKLPKRF